MLRPVLDWLTTTYTFTNRRFIKRSGLIAKEGRTIPLNRISGVDFEIGVIDRIFGCGTLIVSDASTHGRVLLDDIPQVEQVQLQGRRGAAHPGARRPESERRRWHVSARRRGAREPDAVARARAPRPAPSSGEEPDPERRSRWPRRPA